MYEKIRGHHCWWLGKDGVSIGNFDINGCTSDEQAEKHVDEIIINEKYLKKARHSLKLKNQEIKALREAYEGLENKLLFHEGKLPSLRV